MPTFNIGDKVTRDERDSSLWLGSGKVLHGVVTRVYSRPIQQINPDFILGPYPELYGVLWEEIGYKQGYLPHGINGIND